ncbi:hypothetical protein B0H14DRAFT_2582228 [Mycena olivaceomarginata]|nr:hypothetical protein B0H14DRAFT_2582228 [Mycena olivaceomarginata]
MGSLEGRGTEVREEGGRRGGRGRGARVGGGGKGAERDVNVAGEEPGDEEGGAGGAGSEGCRAEMPRDATQRENTVASDPVHCSVDASKALLQDAANRSFTPPRAAVNAGAAMARRRRVQSKTLAPKPNSGKRDSRLKTKLLTSSSGYASSMSSRSSGSVSGYPIMYLLGIAGVGVLVLGGGYERESAQLGDDDVGYQLSEGVEVHR